MTFAEVNSAVLFGALWTGTAEERFNLLPDDRWINTRRGLSRLAGLKTAVAAKEHVEERFSAEKNEGVAVCAGCHKRWWHFGGRPKGGQLESILARQTKEFVATAAAPDPAG